MEWLKIITTVFSVAVLIIAIDSYICAKKRRWGENK